MPQTFRVRVEDLEAADHADVDATSEKYGMPALRPHPLRLKASVVDPQTGLRLQFPEHEDADWFRRSLGITPATPEPPRYVDQTKPSTTAVPDQRGEPTPPTRWNSAEAQPIQVHDPQTGLAFTFATEEGADAYRAVMGIPESEAERLARRAGVRLPRASSQSPSGVAPVPTETVTGRDLPPDGGRISIDALEPDVKDR